VSSSEPLLDVRGLSSAWGRTPVLRSVSLRVGVGEYFVLLGPNGSGKTTLLRCLAGLERPTSGRISLAGRDVTDVPAHRRGIGLMFQEAALFAHRSVVENIAYAPLLQRRPPSDVEEIVGRAIALLHLEGFEDRRPDALSGGERQRVALARTLAARPPLVLLDEPFASIDVEVKADLRVEFRAALAASRTAAIHVTHDREEGLFLGDRVGLLFDGAFAAVGRSSEVFDAPTDARSARFLGYNVVHEDGGWVAVDPREIELGAPAPGARRATVEAVGPVGRETLVVLRDESGARLEVRAADADRSFAPGDAVGLRWRRSVRLGG
jgi:ABC-type Fe3+/spermidine/putrescine transport system ATPase subunit